MLLRLFRGIGPGTIIVIVFSLVLVWLKALLDPVVLTVHYNTDPAPLYSLFAGFFTNNPRAGIIFSMLMVLIISTYLVNFNTRLFFINERTFLPASLYVVLSGYITTNQAFNPVLPASLLLLISIDRLIASYRKPGIAYNLFDASLLIGVAGLIYVNMIWFYVLIIAGIILFRSLNFRELLLSIVGLITPFVILYAFFYLTGRDISWLSKLLLGSIITEVPDFYWSPELIIISALNLLILLLSVLHLLGIFNTKKVRSRKIFSLLIFMLFLNVLVYFAVPATSVELMYIFLIPLVYLLTHYLIMMRNKKIANYVFAIILLTVVFIQLS